MKFRLANLDDARLLYEWRNDPQTRASSINSEPIAWDTHVAWLARRLDRDEPHLYLAEVDGVLVGTFRLDGDEISYSIAPDSRGKGLAQQMLAMASERFGAKIALVKKSNAASARAAEKAGHRVVVLDE